MFCTKKQEQDEVTLQTCEVTVALVLFNEYSRMWKICNFGEDKFFFYRNNCVTQQNTDETMVLQCIIGK